MDHLHDNHTENDQNKTKENSTQQHEHNHMHGGNKQMDHDAAMTDPKMAAFMERDMRNRFLWSLLFTIPTVLYSALFTEFFKISLPTPIPHNWLMFLLTTPVVFKIEPNLNTTGVVSKNISQLCGIGVGKLILKNSVKRAE